MFDFFYKEEVRFRVLGEEANECLEKTQTSVLMNGKILVHTLKKET